MKKLQSTELSALSPSCENNISDLCKTFREKFNQSSTSFPLPLRGKKTQLYPDFSSGDNTSSRVDLLLTQDISSPILKKGKKKINKTWLKAKKISLSWVNKPTLNELNGLLLGGIRTFPSHPIRSKQFPFYPPKVDNSFLSPSCYARKKQHRWNGGEEKGGSRGLGLAGLLFRWNSKNGKENQGLKPDPNLESESKEVLWVENKNQPFLQEGLASCSMLPSDSKKGEGQQLSPYFKSATPRGLPSILKILKSKKKESNGKTALEKKFCFLESFSFTSKQREPIQNLQNEQFPFYPPLVDNSFLSPSCYARKKQHRWNEGEESNMVLPRHDSLFSETLLAVLLPTQGSLSSLITSSPMLPSGSKKGFPFLLPEGSMEGQQTPNNPLFQDKGWLSSTCPIPSTEAPIGRRGKKGPPSEASFSSEDATSKGGLLTTDSEKGKDLFQEIKGGIPSQGVEQTFFSQLKQSGKMPISVLKNRTTKLLRRLFRTPYVVFKTKKTTCLQITSLSKAKKLFNETMTSSSSESEEIHTKKGNLLFFLNASKNMTETNEKDDNFLKKLTKESEPHRLGLLHNKFFRMPYRKPFFSYWLLPFIGLMTLIPDSKLRVLHTNFKLDCLLVKEQNCLDTPPLRGACYPPHASFGREQQALTFGEGGGQVANKGLEKNGNLAPKFLKLPLLVASTQAVLTQRTVGSISPLRDHSIPYLLRMERLNFSEKGGDRPFSSTISSEERRKESEEPVSFPNLFLAKLEKEQLPLLRRGTYYPFFSKAKKGEDQHLFRKKLAISPKKIRLDNSVFPKKIAPLVDSNLSLSSFLRSNSFSPLHANGGNPFYPPLLAVLLRKKGGGFGQQVVPLLAVRRKHGRVDNSFLSPSCYARKKQHRWNEGVGQQEGLGDFLRSNPFGVATQGEELEKNCSFCKKKSPFYYFSCDSSSSSSSGKRTASSFAAFLPTLSHSKAEILLENGIKKQISLSYFKNNKTYVIRKKTRPLFFNQLLLKKLNATIKKPKLHIPFLTSEALLPFPSVRTARKGIAPTCFQPLRGRTATPLLATRPSPSCYAWKDRKHAPFRDSNPLNSVFKENKNRVHPGSSDLKMHHFLQFSKLPQNTPTESFIFLPMNKSPILEKARLRNILAYYGQQEVLRDDGNLLNQLSIFRNLISLSTKIQNSELLFSPLPFQGSPPTKSSTPPAPQEYLGKGPARLSSSFVLLPVPCVARRGKEHQSEYRKQTLTQEPSPLLLVSERTGPHDKETRIYSEEKEYGEHADKKSQSKKIPSLQKLCDQIFLYSCLNPKKNHQFFNQEILHLRKLNLIGEALSENQKDNKKLIEGGYISWLKNEFSFISLPRQSSKEENAPFPPSCYAREVASTTKFNQKIRKGLLSFQRKDSSHARPYNSNKHRFFFLEGRFLRNQKSLVVQEKIRVRRTGFLQEEILKMRQPILISGFKNNLLGKRFSLKPKKPKVKEKSIQKPSLHLVSKSFSYPFLNFNNSVNSLNQTDLSKPTKTQIQSAKQEGLPFLLSKTFPLKQNAVIKKSDSLEKPPSITFTKTGNRSIPNTFRTAIIPFFAYLNKKSLALKGACFVSFHANGGNPFGVGQQEGDGRKARRGGVPSVARRGCCPTPKGLPPLASNPFGVGQQLLAVRRKQEGVASHGTAWDPLSKRDWGRSTPTPFVLKGREVPNILLPTMVKKGARHSVAYKNRNLFFDKGELNLASIKKITDSFTYSPGEIPITPILTSSSILKKGKSNPMLPVLRSTFPLLAVPFRRKQGEGDERVHRFFINNTPSLRNRKKSNAPKEKEVRMDKLFRSFLSQPLSFLGSSSFKEKHFFVGQGNFLSFLSFIYKGKLNLLSRKGLVGNTIKFKNLNSKSGASFSFPVKESNLLFNNRFNFSKKVEKQKTNFSLLMGAVRFKKRKPPLGTSPTDSKKGSALLTEQQEGVAVPCEATPSCCPTPKGLPPLAWSSCPTPKGLEARGGNPFGVGQQGTTNQDSNQKPNSHQIKDLIAELKKKRRALKQRRETGRLLKRKRFYPRPAWVRKTMYKKFLKYRHRKSLPFTKKGYVVRKGLLPPTTLLGKAYYSDSVFSATIRKTAGRKRNFITDSSEKANESNLISLLSLEGKTPFFIKKDVKRTVIRRSDSFSPPPIVVVEKAYYNLSQNVFAEFQEGLWKSSWLRTNLNLYLRKIKNSFLIIKKTSLRKHSCFREPKRYQLALARETNQNPTLQKKWNTVLRIAEYNQITYNRIQQIISNLKNSASDSFDSSDKLLTLKPFDERKKRPFNNARHKFKKPISKDLTIFTFANTVIQTPRALKESIHTNLTENPFFTIQAFGNMSKKRVYWALNKTQTWNFKSSNKKEYLWANQKQREQNRSNKTKKIIKKILTLINEPLQEPALLASCPLPLHSSCFQPLWGRTASNPTSYKGGGTFGGSRGKKGEGRKPFLGSPYTSIQALLPLLSDPEKTSILPDYNTIKSKESILLLEAPNAKSAKELKQSNEKKWQKSLNTFLKKQKQKENKMGDLGFLESKGFFRFKERLPVLSNNSNLSFFSLFSVPLTNKNFSTTSLEGLYKEAIVSPKNSLLKEHKLFLRNLKNTLRVSKKSASYTKKNQFLNHFNYHNLSHLEKKSEGNAFAKSKSYVKHNFLTVPLLGANNSHFFNLTQIKQKNHFFRKELNQTRKQFIAMGASDEQGTYKFIPLLKKSSLSPLLDPYPTSSYARPSSPLGQTTPILMLPVPLLAVPPQGKDKNSKKEKWNISKQGIKRDTHHEQRSVSAKTQRGYSGTLLLPEEEKEGFSFKVFLFCTIIFHLCSLFSLVSISQIRDVIKFSVLFGLKLTAFAKAGGLVPSITKNSRSKKKGALLLSRLLPFLALLTHGNDKKLYIVRNSAKISKNLKIKRAALLYFKSQNLLLLKNTKRNKLLSPLSSEGLTKGLHKKSSPLKVVMNEVYSGKPALFEKSVPQEVPVLIRRSFYGTLFWKTKQYANHILLTSEAKPGSSDGGHFKSDSSLIHLDDKASINDVIRRIGKKNRIKRGRFFYLNFALIPKIVFFMNRQMFLKNASLKPLLLPKKSTFISFHAGEQEQQEGVAVLPQRGWKHGVAVPSEATPSYEATPCCPKEARGGSGRDQQGSSSYGRSRQINSINLLAVLTQQFLFKANKTKSIILNTFLKYGFKKVGSIFHNSVSKFTEIRNTGIQSISIFLGKPSESSTVWINNIFLIEIASDLTTTIPENSDSAIWNIFTKLAKSSSLRITPFLGTLLEKRLFSSFELFIERFSQPDTDLIVRQQKGKIFWDIWGEVLKNVAEENNINITLLSNKKEDQSFLLSKLLENNRFLQPPKHTFFVPPTSNSTSTSSSYEEGGSLLRTTSINPFIKLGVPLSFAVQQVLLLRRERFYKSLNMISANRKEKVPHNQTNTSLDSFHTNWRRWSANQYLTFKGKDSDLLIQAPPAPKSFHTLYPSGSVAREGYNSLKKNSGMGKNYNFNASSLIKGIAPLGTIICQIYSGLFSKETAKNFLVVGTALNQTISSSSSSSSSVIKPPSPSCYAWTANKNSNYDEKSLLIQSLAGETEMKIIRDNANRYNFALGIKSLRNVFDALALHTPCLFLIEDIHVIGERRPLLVGDDENATGSSASTGGESSSGSESHDEKNLSMAKLTRHSVMHYRKPFRGDFSFLIPANNYSFDLFLAAPTYEIIGAGRAKQTGNTSYGRTAPLSPISLESSFSDSEKKSKENFIIRASNLQSSRQLSKRNFSLKTQNIVKELPWIGLTEQSTSHISMKGVASSSGSSPVTGDFFFKQKQSSSGKPGVSGTSSLPKIKYSIRVKIALLASLAVSNLSVKLNMITDLLVIIDSVRSNRGFVVFATTHTPSILDPALRRPGRLDETIALPFIPKLESRWEIVKSNVASLNSGSSSSSSSKTPLRSKPSFFYTGSLVRRATFSPKKTPSERSLDGPMLKGASDSKKGYPTSPAESFARSHYLAEEELGPFKGVNNGKPLDSFLAPLLKTKGDSGFPIGLTVDLLDYGLFNLSLSKSSPFLATQLLPLLAKQGPHQLLRKNSKKRDGTRRAFLQTELLSFPLIAPTSTEGAKIKKMGQGTGNKKAKIIQQKNSPYNANHLRGRWLSPLETEGVQPLPWPIPFYPPKVDTQRVNERDRLRGCNIALRTAYSKIGQFLINNKFVSCADTNLSLFSTLHAKLENQITFSSTSSVTSFGNNSSPSSDATSEDGLILRKIPASSPSCCPKEARKGAYLHLYSKQENIKQYLIGLFAPKVTETLAFSSNPKKKRQSSTFYPYNKVKSPSCTLRSKKGEEEPNSANTTALLIAQKPFFKDPVTTLTPLKPAANPSRLTTAKKSKTGGNNELLPVLKGACFQPLRGRTARRDPISCFQPLRGRTASTPSCEARDRKDKHSWNEHIIPNLGLWSLQGIDKTWRAASSLIFTLIEKRLIYKKTVIIPKLLQFYNAAVQKSSLQDAPSPPTSFLLLPAKRYENYKRSFLAMQFGVSASSSSFSLKGPTELVANGSSPTLWPPLGQQAVGVNSNLSLASSMLPSDSKKGNSSPSSVSRVKPGSSPSSVYRTKSGSSEKKRFLSLPFHASEASCFATPSVASQEQQEGVACSSPSSCPKEARKKPPLATTSTEGDPSLLASNPPEVDKRGWKHVRGRSLLPLTLLATQVRSTPTIALLSWTLKDSPYKYKAQENQTRQSEPLKRAKLLNLVPLIRTKAALRSKPPFFAKGEEFFDKPTVFNGYYRSRILDRHRGYLNNQWWNGQLYEHNVETTFLSDIDWRSNFVSALSSKKQKQTILLMAKPLNFKSSRFFVKPEAKELPTQNRNQKSKGFLRFRNTLPLLSGNIGITDSLRAGLITTSLKKEDPEKLLVLPPSSEARDRKKQTPDSSKTPIFISKVSELLSKNQQKEDFFIDFPDFDQHYNPGNRRWVLHFGYWSYWYNFKTTHNSEIYSYMVTEAFLTTFNYLNSNREIIDYFVTKIMKSGLIKEISIVDGLKRF